MSMVFGATLKVVRWENYYFFFSARRSHKLISFFSTWRCRHPSQRRRKQQHAIILGRNKYLSNTIAIKLYYHCHLCSPHNHHIPHHHLLKLFSLAFILRPKKRLLLALLWDVVNDSIMQIEWKSSTSCCRFFSSSSTTRFYYFSKCMEKVGSIIARDEKLNGIQFSFWKSLWIRR